MTAGSMAPRAAATGTMRWTVSFDVRQPRATVMVEGGGCDVVESGGGTQVIVRLPYGDHVLATFGAGRPQIFAGSSLFPVFGRMRGARLVLGNRAADLIDSGETVRLSTYVLLQQLLGANYPQYNVFCDLVLLEANAEYEVADGSLRYVRTALLDAAGRSGRAALDILYETFAAVARTRRPLCVLISGGYDSRFNLALALAQAREFGNEIHTFHEYKNDEEFGIAKAVADRAGVRFHCEPRTAFTAAADDIIFDPEFIRFHSVTYRDNIPRWHGYLRRIQQTVPDGIIVGHGAEGHKGKFYGQVLDIRRDTEAVFGTDPARIPAAARDLGLRGFDGTSQRRYFDELETRARQFDNRFASVDFLHYHTYVVNGYAHRTYNFQQYFGVPFPFADNRFLATVFGLPPEMKRNFKIVTDGLSELTPELLEIPFTSGNAKALKERSGIRELVRKRLAPLRSLKQSMGERPKQRALAAHAVDRMRTVTAGSPRSDITARLQSFLETPTARGAIRPTAALQACLYLRMLEEEKDLTFTCV